MAAAPYWRDHWQDHARQWSLIGSPLRPTAEDISIMKAALGPNPGPGLLLGVTPELAQLGRQTIAVDHNSTMIEKLSSGKVVFGEWLSLPFEPESFEFAAGDGSLNMLNYPGEYEMLFKQLKKVLKKNAKIIFRVFTSPPSAENIEDVVTAALNGEIGSFHAFKWRLAMAVAAFSNNANIAVVKIYEAFASYFPNREELAKASGWPLADINTIDVYKGSDVVYSFPTLAELRKAVSPIFREVSLANANYELSDRCPIITLTT